MLFDNMGEATPIVFCVFYHWQRGYCKKRGSHIRGGHFFFTRDSNHDANQNKTKYPCVTQIIPTKRNRADQRMVYPNPRPTDTPERPVSLYDVPKRAQNWTLSGCLQENQPQNAVTALPRRASKHPRSLVPNRRKSSHPLLNDKYKGGQGAVGKRFLSRLSELGQGRQAASALPDLFSGQGC